jgi:hypothetical protein
MTLPPAPDKPIFRLLNSPRQVTKDIFIEYTRCNLGISLWSQEYEMKLVYGNQIPFDEHEAVNRICAEYGIHITSTVTQVLRGTKLTIEVTLRE